MTMVPDKTSGCHGLYCSKAPSSLSDGGLVPCFTWEMRALLDLLNSAAWEIEQEGDKRLGQYTKMASRNDGFHRILVCYGLPLACIYI